MKPQIQKLPLSDLSSFVTDKFVTPYFETPWHFHTEYELALIIEGNGKRFVGNHVSDYSVGQVDFLGPNLPHWYHKDDPASSGGALVIHFREEFLGKEFCDIPEMQIIKQLFEKSRMGIQFYGKTSQQINKSMKAMLDLQGMDRLINLLSLLLMMANSTEYKLLSSSWFVGQNDRDNDRLNAIFEYVMNNYKTDISSKEIADLAMMSYSGFCRYFKNRTKKNFSSFVNEIRIGNSCKQLLEGDDVSVSEVCYDNGFNNMSNFNKQFKKIVKCTPYSFKQRSKML
ncbi:AraC family transcriptional regulator [Dyadobacter sp. 32]|uniref:AraC family transcriptional regulator n=1 Tax=Dyadobacter sp. 32 TaxID=538966 RepID=UPI0011ECD7A4